MTPIDRFKLIALVTAVALVPFNMVVADASQRTVAQTPPILTPSPTQPPDLVISAVDTIGQPGPCEGDYDQLENLSSGDFTSFQAYQRARAALVQQLRACETQAGYPVYSVPPPTPACSAGKATTFTIQVRNIGTGYTPHRAAVLLSVDGVPTATSSTTVDDFAPGAETTVTIGGVVLASGIHAFTVTVNPDHEFVESDFSNNTFSDASLSCV